MGGVVKGIKKAFKAVGHFVKKYWKVIVIAAAIYFTAGMAMAAMAPAAGATTAGTVAGVEAGAGYSAMAVGTAATATEAGSMTAALGITTAEGYGAAAAGMGAAEFTAAGGVAASVGLDASMTAGAADAAMTGVAGSMAGDAGESGAVSGQGFGGGFGGEVADAGTPIEPAMDFGADTASAATGGTAAPTSLLSKAGGAVKGFWGGMSTGEKLSFAATAFNALSGAMKEPTRAEEGLWPGGAYFGMDEKGNKTDLASAYANGLQGKDVHGNTTPPATAATTPQQAAPEPGQMQAGGAMDTSGTMGTQGGGTDTQGNNLPTAASGAASGSDFLPASGSGAANAQRATQSGQRNLAQAATRNEKFFDDLRDRLDANRT